MPANVPTVTQYHPFVRQGQTLVVGAAQWVDNIVLAPGVAKTYARPLGTNPAGGVTTISGPGGSTVTATIFRITANGGPIWVDFNGNAAAVPAADKLTGNGSVCIPPGLPYFVAIPVNAQPISFIADAPVAVAIEAWW